MGFLASWVRVSGCIFSACIVKVKGMVLMYKAWLVLLCSVLLFVHEHKPGYLPAFPHVMRARCHLFPRM